MRRPMPDSLDLALLLGMQVLQESLQLVHVLLFVGLNDPDLGLD